MGCLQDQWFSELRTKIRNQGVCESMCRLGILNRGRGLLAGPVFLRTQNENLYQGVKNLQTGDLLLCVQSLNPNIKP